MADTILFGKQPAPPAPERTDFEKMADALYAPVQEQTEMYPLDVAMRTVEQQRRHDQLNVLGRSEADAAAFNRQFREGVLRPSGVDAYILGRILYDEAISADVADARDPSDDAAVLANLRETVPEVRARVRDAFGEDTDDLLARADKFVRSVPSLHALLGRRGIGSKEAVVMGLVDHVRRVNFR